MDEKKGKLKGLVDTVEKLMETMIKEELQTPEGCNHIAELLGFTIAGFCDSVIDDPNAHSFNHAQAKAIARMLYTILDSNKKLAIVDKE